ncbi:chitin biosynthesis protein Chs5p [Diutina catenulata]
MVEVSLTVGKLDASLALLLTKDHHLIEFPTILLPNGVKAGSIVKIKCEQDSETEREEHDQFVALQNEILSTFGTALPKPPVLRVKNVTQTLIVLEWDPLDLGTATLKNLVLFKDDKKLGAIPQPLTNKTTKLSGLQFDKEFTFQLRLDTTAGTYMSDVINVRTHKMTDLSGITVCLGDFSANEPFSTDDIESTLSAMGAHAAQKSIQVDTTHYICTRENPQNEEFVKAQEMNIPIVRPEWLKACERERRIVGVRSFYVKDCSLPDIFAKDYWGKGTTAAAATSAGAAAAAEAAAPPAHETEPEASEPAPKEASTNEAPEAPAVVVDAAPEEAGSAEPDAEAANKADKEADKEAIEEAEAEEKPAGEDSQPQAMAELKDESELKQPQASHAPEHALPTTVEHTLTPEIPDAQPATSDPLVEGLTDDLGYQEPEANVPPEDPVPEPTPEEAPEPKAEETDPFEVKEVEDAAPVAAPEPDASTGDLVDINLNSVANSQANLADTLDASHGTQPKMSLAEELAAAESSPAPLIEQYPIEVQRAQPVPQPVSLKKKDAEGEEKKDDEKPDEKTEEKVEEKAGDKADDKTDDKTDDKAENEEKAQNDDGDLEGGIEEVDLNDTNTPVQTGGKNKKKKKGKK